MINLKNKIHEQITDDNEEEVNKILWNHAMRWFGFGMGIGFIVTALLFGFLRS